MQSGYTGDGIRQRERNLLNACVRPMLLSIHRKLVDLRMKCVSYLPRIP